jgi:hypothetical protein
MKARSQAALGRRALSLALMLATALAAALASAGPAEARSSSQYRETGRAASTYWEQYDNTPTGSQFGNVHIGWLSAFETTTGVASAWGWIEDWDCEEGQKPGGGHGEEPSEGCVWVGERWLEGDGLAFSMDKKMTTATLKGQLIAYGGGHGEEGEVGRPNANIVWSGIGGTYTTKYTNRYRDGNTTWTETYNGTERSATMGGTLGPMGFDPDFSGGYLTTYKTSSKSRTK